MIKLHSAVTLAYGPYTSAPAGAAVINTIVIVFLIILKNLMRCDYTSGFYKFFDDYSVKFIIVN